MITQQEAMQPIEMTCARCGGTAWAVPFVMGGVLCPVCTFGDPKLTLIEMIQKLYGDEDDITGRA